jgi:uncharacterized protein with HEPN domain
VSRDWTLYLGDIADACRIIEEFTAGMSGESFAGNALAFHATVRNLEIVGEAAKRLSDEAKARMPEVDWVGAARFRDVAALGKAGLVIVTEKTHPGHGRMKEVRARATAIKLEALVA